MRVAITGGGSPLARQVASALEDSCDVRLVRQPGDGEAPGQPGALTGDLRDPEFARSAVEGASAVIHLEPLCANGSEPERVDRATRGTYVLLQEARAAGVGRAVLGSTLGLFRRLPTSWRVTESWRPRPEPVPDQLGPWLAELSAREFGRARLLERVVCLRFGALRGEGETPVAGEIALDDAAAAVRRALEFEASPGWSVYHLDASTARRGAAGRAPFSFEPRHPAGQPPERVPESVQATEGAWEAALAPPAPVPSRTVRNVVVFGAGGPLAAATTRVLAASYRLRATDLTSLEEIRRTERRQSPNAPLPDALAAPHDERVVDVTRPDQVAEAVRGMDAIVNCTVIRSDPVEAFRVNTLGALNIARAAVAHRVRRLVQTGPQLVQLAQGEGYGADYDVPGDAPPRAADHLYGHSKYLGQEILRVFAEYYGLEVPVLLFLHFVNPAADDQTWNVGPFAVSWEDAAHAIRRSLEVPSFPTPYEVMNVSADLPHGKFSNERAKRLLGWEPRDRLERYWIDPGG